MDPLSVLTGVVALVETGTNVAMLIKSKVDAFDKAKDDVDELAHGIDLCTWVTDDFHGKLQEQSRVGKVPKQMLVLTDRLVRDVSTLASLLLYIWSRLTIVRWTAHSRSLSTE